MKLPRSSSTSASPPTSSRIRPRAWKPSSPPAGPSPNAMDGRSPSSSRTPCPAASPWPRRTVLLDALAALARGDILLVAKRDRLSRGDMMTTAMIEAAVERAGARIVSAAGEGTESDDPASVLMRRIVDAFGEYERLLIKARTRAALLAKKARGERYGQVPYGRRLAGDGIRLEADPAEAETVAAHRRAAGRQDAPCGPSPASSTAAASPPSPDGPGSTPPSTTS